MPDDLGADCAFRSLCGGDLLWDWTLKWIRVFLTDETTPQTEMIPDLSASKVAGFIGLHKYQSSDEIAYELLARDPIGKKKIAELQAELRRESYNKLVQTILREPAVRDCIATGVTAAQSTTNVTRVLEDVQCQAETVLALRHESLSTEVRARVADEIRGQVSKQRGLNNEETILDAYEAAREVKVTERNTKLVKKDCGTYRLIGRCDGYVASQNRIVDSKERTRAWPTIPLYDEIQLRCYMQLYGATESELIERFPDKTTRTTVFANDEEKWSHIHSLLERNVAKLNEALDDAEELKRIVVANTVAVS